MLCSCDALAASAPAKDSAPPSQGAHKQGLKRRHLRAEGVIFLGVCVEQPSDGRQHFIAPAASTPVVAATAAAFATLTAEPIPSISVAAAVNAAGVAIMYDIRNPLPTYNGFIYKSS